MPTDGRASAGGDQGQADGGGAHQAAGPGDLGGVFSDATAYLLACGSSHQRAGRREVTPVTGGPQPPIRRVSACAVRRTSALSASGPAGGGGVVLGVGHRDPGDRVAVVVEHRGGDAGQARGDLAVLDGVAALPGLREHPCAAR